MKTRIHPYLAAALTAVTLVVAPVGNAGTLTLTGQGVVQFVPDAAHFVLTTQSRGSSADAARTATDKRVAAWEKAAADLLDQFHHYDDSQITVHERTDYDEQGRPADQRYFQATQTIRFDLLDLDLLNRVIAAAETADLSYQLTEDSYYASQNDALEDAALAAAIEDAQARCRFIAERLNAECGDVESLRVIDQGGYPRPLMAMDARSESVSRISEREIKATVEASFQLD